MEHGLQGEQVVRPACKKNNKMIDKLRGLDRFLLDVKISDQIGLSRRI